MRETRDQLTVTTSRNEHTFAVREPRQDRLIGGLRRHLVRPRAERVSGRVQQRCQLRRDGMLETVANEERVDHTFAERDAEERRQHHAHHDEQYLEVSKREQLN